MRHAKAQSAIWAAHGGSREAQQAEGACQVRAAGGRQRPVIATAEIAGHADMTGYAKTGEKHRSAKLKAEDMPEISRMLTEGEGYHKVARRFGVRPSSIYGLVVRKSWRGIYPGPFKEDSTWKRSARPKKAGGQSPHKNGRTLRSSPIAADRALAEMVECETALRAVRMRLPYQIQWINRWSIGHE